MNCSIVELGSCGYSKWERSDETLVDSAQGFLSANNSIAETAKVNEPTEQPLGFQVETEREKLGMINMTKNVKYRLDEDGF